MKTELNCNTARNLCNLISIGWTLGTEITDSVMGDRIRLHHPTGSHSVSVGVSTIAQMTLCGLLTSNGSIVSVKAWS